MSKSLKKTILLVEDEAILALNEKMELEKYGYAVKTVNNGEKAIEAVKTLSDIDLILMDINLGNGIDGTQAAEIILKDRDIPIVFLSSHSDRETVEKTENITSYGYVVKSSSTTVLDASIKMAFKLFEKDKALQENEYKYRMLFENMNESFAIHEAIYDDLGNPVDYRFLEMNPMFLNKLCCDASAIRGHTAKELFPNTEQYWIDIFGEVAKTGKSASFENYSSELGKWFNTHVFSPQKNQFASFFIDITEHKKIEADLMSQRELYEQILEQSLAGYWDWDIPTGNEYLSPTFKKMFGYEDDEIENRADSWQKLIFAEDLPSVYDKFNLHVESKGAYPYYNEVRYHHKNGSTVWVICTGKVIEWDDNGKAKRMIGYHIDITERKRFERELLDSEERLRSYMENAPDGVFIVDETGKYIEVNPAACKMTGYSESELLQKNIIDLIQERDTGKAVEHFTQVQREGSAYGDIGFITKNRESRYWTVAAVKLSDFRFLGFTKDITDRKQIEERLKEEEEKYRFALEGSNLAEWDWNLKTNEIKRNARWAEMLGYAPDEINGNLQQGLELEHPADYEKKWKTIQDHLDGKTDYYSVEYRMKMKNGSYKWIHDCGKIMERDVDGKPLRLCGTHADVDEKRIARNKIDALLAEKELILKEVHHRIKNNLNTVSGLLSLQASSMTDPVAITALSDAKNRIQSMSVLYDKLYMATDYTQLSVTDYLTPLIDDIIQNFPNSQIVKVEKNVHDFVLDVKRLQPLGVIINELLTNIMKYAFIGKEHGQITISATNTDGHVTIIVQDNGNGIPESVSVENSTGFGLQLVNALAQQLNAIIRIVRDNGTKIILEFN